MRKVNRSPPKYFIVRDIHGRDWTTKEILQKLFGIRATDSKKFFYEIPGGRKDIKK